VRSYSIFGGGRCRASWSGYVKLNGVAVWQASFCGNFPRRRGINVLLIDPFTCSRLESRNFDTLASSSVARALRDYLRGVDNGVVIVGVTADEPSTNLNIAAPALQELGVEVSDVRWRGSFVFVAQKGYPYKAVFDKVLTERDSHSAPARLNVTLEGIHLKQLCLLSQFYHNKHLCFFVQ